MSETKKKYRCLLPTNGHEAGSIVSLTEGEVNNFNAGEPEPRFVLAEEGAEEVAAEEATTESSPADQQPAAGNVPEATGNYDEEKNDTPESNNAPADGGNTTEGNADAAGGSGAEGASTNNPTE